MKKTFGITALFVCLAAFQAQANTVLSTTFYLTSTSSTDVKSYTDTFTAGTFSITAYGYDCKNSGGSSTYCYSAVSVDDSANHQSLGTSTYGLGEDNYTGSYGEYAIPNNEFVQIDFSALIKALGGSSNIKDIIITNSDTTSWYVYVSSAKGYVEGSSGSVVASNLTTATATITSSVLGSNTLVSVAAGQNCHTVIQSITVEYYAPEPATCFLMGFALIGMGIAGRKLRRRS